MIKTIVFSEDINTLIFNNKKAAFRKGGRFLSN